MDYPALPEAVEHALAGLTDPDFDLARARGAWTIREIVHHIVDSYDTAWHCIQAAIGKPGSVYTLDWYDPDNTWSSVLKYAQRPIEPALTLLKARHAYAGHILNLVPDAPERFVIFVRSTGTPPRQLTVAEILAHVVVHTEHHIGQIRQTRQVHRR